METICLKLNFCLLHHQGTAMKKTILTAVILASITAGAWAQEASPLTANISLMTDYRFRGISQTMRDPALQGGFDYAHSSGFYVGNWNSNVSGVQFLNGSSLEMDFYGGYKFEPMPGLAADIGLLYYYYPGSRYANGEKYNNGEIYFGGTYKWFSAKYFYGVTDFFGVNSGTGYAANGDSKGSGYLDLNATFEVAPKTTLILHAGRQTVKNYGRLNYNDYKVGVAYDAGFGMFSLAVVGTDADEGLYTVTNGRGKSEDLGDTGAVLTFTKTF
jgi:uncharacterized protein (TIGR02001 family)